MVRTEAQQPTPAGDTRRGTGRNGDPGRYGAHPAGAPPLDWHIDDGTYEERTGKVEDLGQARLLIGDVRDRLAELPDGSVDLIVTSPPFLALRSYLPADHPDKHREIGSEATPAAFLDTLLALTAEWRRVLAPHGSLCVELGDTYSGSGGAGGDYGEGGLRDGEPKFRQQHPNTAYRLNTDGSVKHDAEQRAREPKNQAHTTPLNGGRGWPLAKSLCGIPTLYTWGLAYGRNLLTGEPSPAGQWRIRNVVVWGRPNPPVGALGDKFRPATSYITVACVGPKRWFDLDAVRTELQLGSEKPRSYREGAKTDNDNGRATFKNNAGQMSNPAGAPPLDWHSDMPDEDGDWLWRLPTAPYPGAHYATYPEKLPLRLIEAMCPRQVCRTCGKARERVSEDGEAYRQFRPETGDFTHADKRRMGVATATKAQFVPPRERTTLGWTDCGHDNYRNGVVLDPFAGSGTTLAVAVGCGRDAIGIELDERNVGLIRERCGMFLEVA